MFNNKKNYTLSENIILGKGPKKSATHLAKTVTNLKKMRCNY